jgi:hypothetical protein
VSLSTNVSSEPGHEYKYSITVGERICEDRRQTENDTTKESFLFVTSKPTQLSSRMCDGCQRSSQYRWFPASVSSTPPLPRSAAAYNPISQPIQHIAHIPLRQRCPLYIFRFCCPVVRYLFPWVSRGGDGGQIAKGRSRNYSSSNVNQIKPLHVRSRSWRREESAENGDREAGPGKGKQWFSQSRAPSVGA